MLEVMAETRHPVTIVTKSALIERDVDLLADMARDKLVQVMFSITTLDPPLARKLEPPRRLTGTSPDGHGGAAPGRRAGGRALRPADPGAERP
jgi:hypothetical protein